jgi:hypothetical protein
MISAVGCRAIKAPESTAEVGHGFQLINWKNEVISGENFDLSTDMILEICFDRNVVSENYRQYLSQKDATPKK